MRMWMCDPTILCRNHLLGEHNELHKLVGHLLKKKSITGWIINNCLEPQSIIEEHTRLVEEMVRRGYNHQSPLPEVDLSYLPLDEQNYKINKEQALYDLLKRCQRCHIDT